MNGKKTAGKVSNVAYVAIIIAIVVVINVLGNRFFGRLDLTENKIYSISPVTKGLLRELEDVVAVKAYFSKKLPVQLSRLPGEVDDMLKEFNIYSRGNVNYERLDPGENEELKRKLAGYGVMPVTMTIIEKDERQQINGYLGMTVSYAEKTEAIPLVQNTVDLEYELTSRIYRVTHKPEKVGFLTDGSRHDLMGDYQAIAEELRKLHEIVPVVLGPGKKVPEDIKALIVAGPDSVSESAKFQLDQFIMRGGRVIFLIDNLVVDQRGQPRLINHGLNAMLLSYGFRLNGDILRDDKAHSPQQVTRGIFTYNQPNPFFPHVTKERLGQHPVVGRLSELTFPWTGSLENPTAVDSSVSYFVLARTTEAAQGLKPPTYQPTGPGEKPLVVLGTGRFKAAFRGSPDPLAPGDSIISRCIQETSVMVIPSSAFIENQFLYPGNMEFMLNMVDFITIGDKLISIRTRPTTDMPLKNIGPEMKNFLRLLNIVGVPILVILFGAVRFYLKRRDKMVRARSL